MMGVKSQESKLFYGFALEDKIPQDHVLRAIKAAVDFSFVHKIARPFYSHTGAPSVDPIVAFKMSLLGYIYNIPSERRLAEDCRLNMAFLWFLDYDIDEITPDHSILSKARSRFGREVYEQFFREIIRQCMDMGLIEGDKLFMDATLLKANASLDSLVSRSLYCQLAKEPSAYLDDVWSINDNDTDSDGDHPPEPGSRPDSKKQTANELRISRTDPDATMVRRKDTKLFLGHKVHMAVDGGEDRIITAVTTTTGTIRESQVCAALLSRHMDAVENAPAEVVADKGYSSRRLYKHLFDMGIKPSIPKARPWKESSRKRKEAGFKYDPERDVYVCPAGKTMYRLKDVGNKKLYQVHRLACKGCPNSGSLCKAKRPTITRSVDDELDQRGVIG
jgi:transposase